MTRRMIDSGMWSNEHFAELPAMARLLLLGIINHADDQGRIKAHPAYLRSQIFPYDDVSLDDIDGWLGGIGRNGTLVVFQVDGKVYAQLLNWWEYQTLLFASPSEYPPPDGWTDRIRYNAKGGHMLTFNWQRADGSMVEDSCDCHGKPLKRAATTSVTHNGSHLPVHVDSHVETQVPVHLRGINKDQIKINTTTTTGRVRENDENAIDDSGSSGSSFSFPTQQDEVHDCWRKNLTTPLTPIIERDLKIALSEHGKEAVLDAIAVAVNADNHTMRYIKGVLKRRGSPTNDAHPHTIMQIVRTDADDD